MPTGYAGDYINLDEVEHGTTCTFFEGPTFYIVVPIRKKVSLWQRIKRWFKWVGKEN